MWVVCGGWLGVDAGVGVGVGVGWAPLGAQLVACSFPPSGPPLRWSPPGGFPPVGLPSGELLVDGGRVGPLCPVFFLGLTPSVAG